LTVTPGAGELIRCDPSDTSGTAVAIGRSFPRQLLGVFLNPYVQLAVGSLLVTSSELLMKKGASAAPTGTVGWFGIGALCSGWTWAGIVTYVLSFLSWVHVLRFVPLGIAYALINVVHVLIPIGARFFLHEDVPLKRWLGISLVVCGLLLILRPVINAEQKL
jgi:multidrug transporter EmrE-like cation transporter